MLQSLCGVLVPWQLNICRDVWMLAHNTGCCIIFIFLAWSLLCSTPSSCYKTFAKKYVLCALLIFDGRGFVVEYILGTFSSVKVSWTAWDARGSVRQTCRCVSICMLGSNLPLFCLAQPVQWDPNLIQNQHCCIKHRYFDISKFVKIMTSIIPQKPSFIRNSQLLDCNSPQGQKLVRSWPVSQLHNWSEHRKTMYSHQVHVCQMVPAYSQKLLLIMYHIMTRRSVTGQTWGTETHLGVLRAVSHSVTPCSLRKKLTRIGGLENLLACQLAACYNQSRINCYLYFNIDFAAKKTFWARTHPRHKPASTPA